MQIKAKSTTFAADLGRIIAIDYGKKRVGIAASDELRLVAGALGTFSPSEALKFLQQYAATQKVDTLVVGYPLNLNGTPAEAAAGAAQFAKTLQKQHPQLTVTTFDERFTSRMAQQAIIDAGVKKKDRRNKALVDKVSACIILQSYMEYKRNGGT